MMSNRNLSILIRKIRCEIWSIKIFETHLTNLWNFVEDNAEVFPLWKCIVSRIAAAWGYDTNSLEITCLKHSKWDETLVLIIYCCFTWRHSSFSSVTKFITESSPFDLSPKLIIIFCQIKIEKNQAAQSWSTAFLCVFVSHSISAFEKLAFLPLKNEILS